MDDSTYLVPLHYRPIVEELRPIINLLQDALLNRPVPSESPLYDVTTSIHNTLDEVSLQTPEIVRALNRLGETFAEEDPTKDMIRLAVLDISKPCETMVEIYRDLWRKPYEEGYETGQIILSAVLEKILRTIYSCLQKIAETVDNPAIAIERTGTNSIDLQIVLEVDSELELLNQWMHNTLHVSSFHATQHKRSMLTPLLGAFGLGWLLGRDK